MAFLIAAVLLHLLLLTCEAGNGVKMVVLSRNQHKAEEEGGYACYVNDSATDVDVQSVKTFGEVSHLPDAQNKSEGIWIVDVEDTNSTTKNDTFGVFGCNATAGEDKYTLISTVRIHSNASIVPRDGMYTKTVSLNDTGVKIAMNVLSPVNITYVRWRNNSYFWETCSDCEHFGVDTFNISGAIQLYHGGVYECHVRGRRSNAEHGMVILVVRACPSSKWGLSGNCSGDCINCLNGGECDENTGKCVCPPGFMGENCSTPCGGNRFGYECEKKCNPTIDCPDKCQGYLFCLSHPLGCRCSTGWKGLDCDEPCTNDTYGANCLQTCNCTNDLLCNRYTGECEAKSTEHEETCGECGCHKSTSCTEQQLTCKGGCIKPWFTENCDIGIMSVDATKVNPGMTASVSCILSEPAILTLSYNVTLSREEISLNDSGVLRTGETTFSVFNVSEGDEVFCQIWKGANIVAWHRKKLPVHGSKFPLLIACVAGGSLLLLLLLMIVCCLVCCRRKKGQKSGSDMGTLDSPRELLRENAMELESNFTFKPNNVTLNKAYDGLVDGKVFNKYDESKGVKEVDFEDDEDDFSDDDFPPPPPSFQLVQKPQPIKITEFYEYMKKKSDNLEAEFMLFKKGKQHPWTVGERAENKEKNRFRDLYAYDHSRVKLKTLPNDDYSDYYNASFIRNQVGEVAFIAAQGPNKASLNDFWRMVWEQRISTIAMVTNLFKGSKRRCSQYWPDKEGSQMSFGKLQVEWTATNYHSNYIIRTLVVSQDNECHEVHQLHFLTWPEKDVPKHHTPFIEFVNRTRQVHAHIKTPLVVHCSAGVGKTGTFIALYCMMDVLLTDIYIDVFYFVEKMRNARINMIQSPKEYIFLHKCLLEYHLTRHTEMQGEILATIDVNLKGDILSEEFELMRYFKEEMTVHQASKSKGGSYKNSAKNRFHHIFPVDENIPRLLTDKPQSEDDAYINATLVNSFRGRNSFITTQSPLPKTVEDFWRMVYDEQCPLIVMLNQLDPKDTMCPQYWPESGKGKYGKITITCTSAEDRTDHIFRAFEVSHKDFRRIHKVCHLQIISWPPEINYFEVLHLIEEMELLQDDFKGTAPTIVHCIDGVGRSGVFVAVKSEMERLTDTRNLNLFSTMKQLRSRNPHILSKWNDYFLCYQILSCFVQEMYGYDSL